MVKAMGEGRHHNELRKFIVMVKAMGGGEARGITMKIFELRNSEKQ
jgi:hypothetical protein